MAIFAYRGARIETRRKGGKSVALVTLPGNGVAELPIARENDGAVVAAAKALIDEKLGPESP